MDHSGGYVVGVRDESIDWFTQADVDEGTISFVSSSDKVSFYYLLLSIIIIFCISIIGISV